MFTIFLFNQKKTFGPCEKGYYFCLGKVDLHWVELKYVDSNVMQVDLEVDSFEWRVLISFHNLMKSTFKLSDLDLKQNICDSLLSNHFVPLAKPTQIFLY